MRGRTLNSPMETHFLSAEALAERARLASEPWSTDRPADLLAVLEVQDLKVRIGLTRRSCKSGPTVDGLSVKKVNDVRVQVTCLWSSVGQNRSAVSAAVSQER